MLIPAPKLSPPLKGGTARAARLRPILLYCGKCMKRCDNGKALRCALKDGVKARAEAIGHKTRMVKVGCLGVCPKKALVAASSSTLARGEAVLLRNPAEVAAVISRLLP